MTSEPVPLRLFLATSGWDGPFQYSQVVVGAPDAESARLIAEEAFAGVVQPVCRARMRIADLGPAVPGVIAGPARSGEPLAAGAEVDARCGVESPDAAGATG